MMLHVPEVLSPEQVREMRAALDATQWTDGRETVSSWAGGMDGVADCGGRHVARR